MKVYIHNPDLMVQATDEFLERYYGLVAREIPEDLLVKEENQTHNEPKP